MHRSLELVNNYKYMLKVTPHSLSPRIVNSFIIVTYLGYISYRKIYSYACKLDYQFLSKDKGTQSTYMHTHIYTRHVTT